MKKIIIFSFLAIFQDSVLFAQLDSPLMWSKRSISGLETLNLKGKVKSLNQFAYKVVITDKNGKPGKGERAHPDSFSMNADFQVEFDSIGRITYEIEYEGDKSWRWTHLYDPLKNTETITKPFNKGKEWTKTVYKYDKNGKVVQRFWEQYFSDQEDFRSTTTWKFDSKGNAVEAENVSAGRNETNSLKTKLKYDNKNQLICTDGYGENGTFWTRQKSEYDAKGQKVREEYYLTDTTKIEHSLTFVYDEKGNVLKKEYQNFLTYTYDAKGNVSKKPDGTMKKVFTYEYTYDKNGNWISRTDYEDGKPTGIIERELVYY